jgi:hypothetical protein
MNNPVWQVFLGLGRYSIFLTTEHTEHTETNSRTVMSCFRVFGVFRGSDLRNEGSYYLQVTEDDFARAAGAKKAMVEG